jgi:hypothetical protein
VTSRAALIALLATIAVFHGTALANAGLRIRNATGAQVVVETRFAGPTESCPEGELFRTYRLAPGQVWIVRARDSRHVCWRFRGESAQRWSSWEKADAATDLTRELEVLP